MIDLTVKTLDSQNHSFSLDDDQITVRGFKEYIAESVAVPADSQRLIYCGRVLQDEKKLNDYDVNGKVIHLVQRAPPQPGQRGNRSGQNQGQTNPLTWQNPQRAHYRLTRAQTHGNTMYVGGMPTPTEVMEGHSVPLPQMVSSFPFRRLSTITRMFDRLNELISYLHDPACPLNNTPSENNQASSGTQESAQEPERERQQGEQMPSMPTSSPWSDDEEDNVTEAQSGSAQAENQTGTQPPQQEQQSDQRSTPTADAQGNRRSVPLLAHAPLAATMLEILVSTINRLRPFMRAYCRLLQADPVLQPGPGPNGIEENQRLVNTVSESLHYLAHACHALSDIIVDLSQPPPRILNSTQTIVQHSAILQHGIPIQVEAYFSVHRRNANNNNGNEESDEDADATTAPESTESTAQDATPQNQSETQPTNQPAPDQPQAQTQSRFGPVLNLSNNLEVLMEVTPEINVYIPSGSDQTQTGETNNNNNNAGRRNPAGIYPWGSTGSPDFLRSFIQTVVGQVAQEGIATTTISTRTSASTTTAQRPVATSVDSGNTNSGQSTQARSNVGTHPTTATQTRSTSRPHIIYQHAHPLGIEMVFGQGFDFDPFLPCNSHHRRRAPNQVGMGGTPPPEETETNETAASESEAQPQTAAAAAASSAANTSSENTTAPSAPPAGTFINLIQQILERVTNQPQVNIGISSNNSNLAENLGDFLQMYSGGNIHVGIIGDRGGNSTGQQIQQTVTDRLGIAELAADLFRSRGPNFLVSLSIMMIDNMTPEGWYRLASGDSEPIAQLRRPLQEFLQSHFHSASLEVIQRQTIILLLLRIGPYLHRLLVIAKNHIGPSGARVNIRATVEALFSRHIKDMLSNLFNSEIDDARFGQEVINSMNNLGRQLCIVIQYAFRGGVSGLDELLSHSWFPPLERGSPGPWIIRRFFGYLRTYSSSIPQPPESEIQPLLVYQDTPSEASSAPSAPVQQTPQTQAEVEPKEMEVVEERTTFESCFADNEENIPETFPGHEVLPSDWVPIIARDTVRQRRQLEMQAVLNEGVTTFSDAYLGVLPTKRRKIIEQQKSRLLVSPTPTQSAIAASLERLVRENINRAGVEEVDGAALAVASNPAVRRNFGGAIRDYLNPRRQGTSDFPDLLRFPNASKYFSEQEKPPK